MTTLLWIFRDRLVTDPRDKIYSLLGIFERGDKDSHTTNFHTKDFNTILKIRILFHYFEAIPIYVAFCICLQSAPCHLNSGRAPIPRRCRRPLAPLIASPPPNPWVLVYLPSYISPFLVFPVAHKLGAGDVQVRPKALRYR
jgi:hypothetical protein